MRTLLFSTVVGMVGTGVLGRGSNPIGKCDY